MRGALPVTVSLLRSPWCAVWVCSEMTASRIPMRKAVCGSRRCSDGSLVQVTGCCGRLAGICTRQRFRRYSRRKREVASNIYINTQPISLKYTTAGKKCNSDNICVEITAGCALRRRWPVVTSHAPRGDFANTPPYIRGKCGLPSEVLGVWESSPCSSGQDSRSWCSYV